VLHYVLLLLVAYFLAKGGWQGLYIPTDLGHNGDRKHLGLLDDETSSKT